MIWKSQLHLHGLHNLLHHLPEGSLATLRRTWLLGICVCDDYILFHISTCDYAPLCLKYPPHKSLLQFCIWLNIKRIYKCPMDMVNIERQFFNSIPLEDALIASIFLCSACVPCTSFRKPCSHYFQIHIQNLNTLFLLQGYQANLSNRPCSSRLQQLSGNSYPFFNAHSLIVSFTEIAK